MTDTWSNYNASSPVWGNYVDLEHDVLPWLQLTSVSTTQTQILQLLIDMTCQWAQKRRGRPIGPTEFFRRFDGWSGWNGAYIMLPYSPVLQVLSVTEWWGTSGPHELQEQTPEHQVTGFTCDYPTGMLTRVFPGLVQRPWFPGSRNLEVTWVAGYNPIPADLKVATIEMIAHWWRNTQQSARDNIRGGSDTAEVVASGLWQGTPLRITSLLDADNQVGIG